MRHLLIAAAVGVLVAPACMAANAHNPYGNVDHRNDAGNDTGDSQVDALNAAQLGGGAYRPAAQGRPYAYGGAGYQPRPYYGSVYAPAPRAYYPPPPAYPSPQAYPGPGYAAPPGYYPPPY